MADQSQVQITRLNVKNNRGCYMAEYSYVVTDVLGAKRSGTGSVAVSNPDAVQSQIRRNLSTKLGYGSFDVEFPRPPAEAKRPVLGVAQR